MKHAAVSEVWKGIRRTHGIAQTQKTPVLVDDVRRTIAVLETEGARLLAVRDRALLLVGFAGAFRRSELVFLDCADIQETADGLVITGPPQQNRSGSGGAQSRHPYGSTPDLALFAACDGGSSSPGITSGPVFRSVNRHGSMKPERLTDKSVALVVKKYAAAAG